MAKNTNTAKRAARFWRFKDAAVPNILALTYCVLCHAFGLRFIIAEPWLLNILGCLLLTSSLIVAAYLIHELAHGLVFYKKRHNVVLGEVLSWLCGASYAKFERIQHMHMRHHADRADIACYNYQDNIRVAPICKRLVYALEWLHVPAVELLMHYQVLVRPFRKAELMGERRRVILTLVSRLAFFVLIFMAKPIALLYYAAAYLVMLKMLYLGDAFAHTYEAYVIEHSDDPVPSGSRDADYDRLNTFSNIVSRRFSWLNLYNLNFGYHNAHHDKPSTPWYNLPKVQRTLYADDDPQYLPYKEVLVSFHKNRLRCILPEHEEGPGTGSGRADNFLGVHGVSFLSII